jgi:hypothetical protein
MLIYPDENLEVIHRDGWSPYLLVTFDEMECGQKAAASGANTAKTDNSLRERLVKATRERFAELRRAGRIAPALHFNWNATTYEVWRCGELSPAGRAAVTA